MSERVESEARAEQQQQRRVARQLKQLQRAEVGVPMAERGSLPSPGSVAGLPWNSWLDAGRTHTAATGVDAEDSFKECVRNREAMRLSRDDMPIFGQCPAQDDFYLVMCSHCSQVVKPQAFQAHFERRHGSNSKSQSYHSSAAYPLSGLSSRGRLSVVGGANSAGVGSASGGNNGATTAKEKLPHRKPSFPLKVPHNDSLTPAVKVEKIHVKIDYTSSKVAHAPSSSSSTVSSSPLKPGLNNTSAPKAQLLPPAHVPNGKGHASSPLDKKPDGSKRLYRRQTEREFNPDIHCGVVDMGARKPCTRSLTCKTHSLSQRRAVVGRRKRFDTLLAEHKNRAREKELLHRSESCQQTPPLREPHPPSSRPPPETHHSNGPAVDAPNKAFALGKPKPHNPGLPRLNSSGSHAGPSVLGGVGGAGDPPPAQESAQHPGSAPTADGATRLSSDEGENEEREENVEKLDCHYSGYHPRPAAFCTFGSRLLGRSCYAFDRRWDGVRCALTVMMDKHVNSLMWKRIPSVLETSSSPAMSSHRSSTNSLSSSSSSGFLSPSPPPLYGQSSDRKSALSYGTAPNARAMPQRPGEHPAYSSATRQVSSSSPQMPSATVSSLSVSVSSSPSATHAAARPPKPRSAAKAFRAREPAAGANGGAASATAGGGGGALSSGKKRKNSSLPTPGALYANESSSSSFKKNCAVNSATSGSSFHASLSSTPPSSSSSSSSSQFHSSGANCPPGRTNAPSLRQDAAARGPHPASPAEPIKRMSVVMNSSDSTLSLGPFVHQGGEQLGHIDAKRRKSSPAGTPATVSGGGAGGLQAPIRPKMSRSPAAINNIHNKHTRPITASPSLSTNSLIHQPKTRP